MNSNSRGFTLIELMIVIAILGILLAIALPAYNDYTIRARVGEGLSMATMAKTSVSETRLQTSRWPTTNLEAGMAVSIQSTYVASIDVGADGVVTIQVRNIDPIVDGQTIQLVPEFANGVVEWECLPGGGSPIEERFMPARCRGG